MLRILTKITYPCFKSMAKKLLQTDRVFKDIS